MYQVIISIDAEDDLDSIAAYIRKDNPRRAQTYTEEISAKILKIAERPRSFPSRSELLPGLRSALHGRYLIFFRFDGDTVEILRIIHGARDLRKLLAGDHQ